jgi:hypothetical protein
LLCLVKSDRPKNGQDVSVWSLGCPWNPLKNNKKSNNSIFPKNRGFSESALALEFRRVPLPSALGLPRVPSPWPLGFLGSPPWALGLSRDPCRGPLGSPGFLSHWPLGSPGFHSHGPTGLLGLPSQGPLENYKKTKRSPRNNIEVGLVETLSPRTLCQFGARKHACLLEIIVD